MKDGCGTKKMIYTYLYHVFLKKLVGSVPQRSHYYVEVLYNEHFCIFTKCFIYLFLVRDSLLTFTFTLNLGEDSRPLMVRSIGVSLDESK